MNGVISPSRILLAASRLAAVHLAARPPSRRPSSRRPSGRISHFRAVFCMVCVRLVLYNGVKPGPVGRHWRVISGSVHLHTAATRQVTCMAGGFGLLVISTSFPYHIYIATLSYNFANAICASKTNLIYTIIKLKQK